MIYLDTVNPQSFDLIKYAWIHQNFTCQLLRKLIVARCVVELSILAFLILCAHDFNLFIYTFFSYTYANVYFSTSIYKVLLCMKQVIYYLHRVFICLMNYYLASHLHLSNELLLTSHLHCLMNYYYRYELILLLIILLMIINII